MLGGDATSGEHYSQVLGASYALFETFPLRAHVPFFQISYYSIAIILVFVSCFTPARGILSGIHTSCTVSPFSVVYD